MRPWFAHVLFAPGSLFTPTQKGSHHFGLFRALLVLPGFAVEAAFNFIVQRAGVNVPCDHC